MRYILFLTITLFISWAHALGQLPTIELLQSGKATNLRGLSSLEGDTIWVSGSGGWIGNSLDGGQSWHWHQPSGFTNRDFRDIAAISHGSAVTIGIDTPAIILKTLNVGKDWQLVYHNDLPGMFLDAVDFIDNKRGIVLGDPVDGHPFLAQTSDGGNHWHSFTAAFNKTIAPGEVFFAASGSNIKSLPKGGFIFSSGGARSNLWLNPGHVRGQAVVTRLPFRQGIATSGPNGMAVKGKTIALVGGDYTKPGQGDSCFAISYDGGTHWQPQHKLPGYGSSVAIINQQKLVACGLLGVWLTSDGGKHWQTIDQRPFNSLLYIPGAKKLFLVGPHGKIGVIKSL